MFYGTQEYIINILLRFVAKMSRTTDIVRKFLTIIIFEVRLYLRYEGNKYVVTRLKCQYFLID